MGPGTWPGHPAATNSFSFHPGNSAFKSPDAFKVSLPLRTNYLYGKIKKTLPELYAFTICLWLRSSASPGIGTPFSYAVPGQANEIVLIEWGNNPIELLINDKVRPAGVSLGPGSRPWRASALAGFRQHTEQILASHSLFQLLTGSVVVALLRPTTGS